VKSDLETMVRLFHDSVDELGDFQEVREAEMPDVYRRLLAHEHHMTVTVEAHHGGPVDVEVLHRRVTDTHYAREILLRRRRDRMVVQFGIMRVHTADLAPAVMREVAGECQPLGRILIEHDVLRQIRLLHLWRLLPSDRLASWMELAHAEATYGRTAILECNGEPAIELLEILTPEP
jgi:chorismate-pyruvate lyase